jgi:hypothetical protein
VPFVRPGPAGGEAGLAPWVRRGGLSWSVDVVNRDGLKPYVKPVVTADAIYAF